MLTTSIGTVRGKMLPGVTPSVSVIVPCYNGGRFIPQLLGSLARQTFRDFEIIIVDDGSTDAATRQALDNLDPSVRVIRQGNKGLSAARNAGIALARALAQQGSVVLVDLAFGAPNLSVVSTDPNAPGIAELVRGTASFGDIITRDQFSAVHIVATGNVGADAAALMLSPMIATVIEALAQSYNHVVIDAGSAADVAVERFTPLTRRVVLVAANPADPATRAAQERLMMAGFADVTLVAGATNSVAA